jgi:hypothetical protein
VMAASAEAVWLNTFFTASGAKAGRAMGLSWLRGACAGRQWAPCTNPLTRIQEGLVDAALHGLQLQPHNQVVLVRHGAGPRGAARASSGWRGTAQLGTARLGRAGVAVRGLEHLLLLAAQHVGRDLLAQARRRHRAPLPLVLCGVLVAAHGDHLLVSVPAPTSMQGAERHRSDALPLPGSASTGVAWRVSWRAGC